MFYKFYNYTLEQHELKVDSYKHLPIFQAARGPGPRGEYALYRGEKSAVLMHIVAYDNVFTGLIGKHATEREITAYNTRTDRTKNAVVDDDDYPHTHFLCAPDIGMIACCDSSTISAKSAMQRLHAILIERTDSIFAVTPLRQVDDLRFAVNHFRVVEVDYEVYRVNPHTGDLGMELDEKNKLDHIEKMKGKLLAKKRDQLQLRGGSLTQVQQLQQSGHARVGHTAETDEGHEIRVPKPKAPRTLGESAGDESPGDLPEVRLSLRGMNVHYPLPDAHVEFIESIMRTFHSARFGA